MACRVAQQKPVLNNAHYLLSKARKAQQADRLNEDISYLMMSNFYSNWATFLLSKQSEWNVLSKIYKDKFI